MSFSDDVTAFAAKVTKRNMRIFRDSVIEVRTSITEGSSVTGAPGQPVQWGTLRDSWQQSFPEQWVGEVTTNLVYAPPIEEGIGRNGPLTLRSEVGGFHSVKLTRAGFGNLVDHVTRMVVND